MTCWPLPYGAGASGAGVSRLFLKKGFSMKKFIVWSSETVYYKTIVEAENEDAAIEWFYGNENEKNTKPYRSDFWQVDDVTELDDEKVTV